jgi:tripartite-type tricarboxylate transporter receptor subunit TctC
MGRPYFLAEGVPADRVKILREAFDATLKDPELLSQAKKERLEINPLNGDAVQQLVVRLYGQPEALVHRTRKILGTEK